MVIARTCMAEHGAPAGGGRGLGIGRREVAELAEDACLPRGGEWYTSRASFAFSSISPLHTLSRSESQLLASAIAGMDPITARDNVFSRGPSTPPPTTQHFQSLPAQSTEPHVSPVLSQLEPAAPSSAQAHLDSLFNGLNAPSASHVSPQPSIASANIYQGPPEQQAHSGPATPASGNAGSVSSNISGPSSHTHDRQNALLSLLGAVSTPSSNPQPIPPVGPVQPQQVPTPPGSAPRPGMTNSESQGKLLLEQLMSG